MNLSIQKFAVAALAGVANARSITSTESTCWNIDLPSTAQYAGRNWKDLQNEYFNYLSQCSDEDEVRYEEGAEFLEEIMSRFR
jgi:hypothetical protein